MLLTPGPQFLIVPQSFQDAHICGAICEEVVPPSLGVRRHLLREERVRPALHDHQHNLEGGPRYPGHLRPGEEGHQVPDSERICAWSQFCGPDIEELRHGWAHVVYQLPRLQDSEAGGADQGYSVGWKHTLEQQQEQEEQRTVGLLGGEAEEEPQEKASAKNEVPIRHRGQRKGEREPVPHMLATFKASFIHHLERLQASV